MVEAISDLVQNTGKINPPGVSEITVGVGPLDDLGQRGGTALQSNV